MTDNLTKETIIIADDHPLFRSALVQALKSHRQSADFLEAASISEVEQVLASHTDADLLVMDLHMPGANGFAGLAHVTSHYPELPVVMISANDNPAVAASASEYQALGFISKSADVNRICEAIDQVLLGETCFPDGSENANMSQDDEVKALVRKVSELTPKQLEVFNLLADGLLNKQIAYEQKVTEATVKAHVTAIMRKLGVNNRTQVVLIASKLAVDESYGGSD